jgi:hypothetical protein
MNATKENINAHKELIDKCAIYLNDNFHKFSQTNKIKISLEIFKRNMPTSPLIDQSRHTHYTSVVQQIRQVLENDGDLDKNRVASITQPL